jgi:hypothetical protein
MGSCRTCIRQALGPFCLWRYAVYVNVNTPLGLDFTGDGLA